MPTQVKGIMVVQFSGSTITLCEADQFRIDVFERLACEEHFVSVTDTGFSAHPWNKVFERAWKERRDEKILKCVTGSRRG